MRRRTKALSAVGLSALFISATIVLGTTDNIISVYTAGGSSVWNHYSKVDASFSSKGIKEYWISCEAGHEIRYSAPTGNVTINDKGSPSSSFIAALPEDDDRLIDPYSYVIDFENGHNSYISIFDRFTSLEIVEGEGIYGTKALKATYSGNGTVDAHLKIDKSYLDAIFSKDDVKALSFYAKGNLETNNFRHKLVDKSVVGDNSLIISCYEANANGYGITNNYKKFYLTREVWQQMDANDWFIQYGGTGPLELYLDNFEISYDGYYDTTKYGLENGYLNFDSSGAVYLRNARTTGAQLLVDGNFSSVGFDYDIYTEGVRSVKVAKTTNVNYYLRAEFSYDNLPEEGIFVDFRTSANLNGWWSGQNIGAVNDGQNVHIVQTVNESFAADKWYTLHLTKSQITTTGRFLCLGGSTACNIYIDNIRLANSVVESFEGHRYTSKFGDYVNVSYYEIADTAASNKLRDNTADYLLIGEWAAFDGASKTYETSSDGLYSLKMSKSKSGGAMRLSPVLVSLMDEDGVITIDAYSNNLTSYESPTIAKNTLKINKGNWTTLTLNYSDFRNGRFTENAFGIGDIYFDNIRMSNKTLYSNAGVVHAVNGGNASIKTSLEIEKFHSLTIDGVTAEATSSSSNEFQVASSSLSEGTHNLVATYYNGGKLICERIFVESVALSAANPASISVEYGDSAYHTLSGYSNVYRMMVDDKEFPFEVSGSSYLLPKAALAELLVTKDGKKTNGVINLKIFSVSGNYMLPLNVSLSNSINVKPLPEYNGGGIGSHAYSSTNSQANRTDYEQYESLEKIAEFQNTGLELMYDQSIQVGLYEYTLSDAEKYLFDNASIYNQKVMVVDSSFTLLGKYNYSLIGTPLYEQQQDGEPTGNKYTNKNIPNNGTDYMFSSTSELDSFVEYRLNLYINHPSCYGVNIGDEQTYKMLYGGYKDLMASIHRVLKKLGREDFYVNSNLQPMTASYLTMTGVEKSSFTDAQREEAYVTYLNAYKECSGLDYVQFDAYPFASSDKASIYEKKGLNKYYMRNLLIAASFCKNNDMGLYFVTQSVTYYGTRILNRSDIAWINNMALGMGVKHVSFFVYCVRKVTGSETWIDGSAFLSIDGSRTDLYYYYTSQIHEMNQFAPVISCFEYEWSRLYSGSSLTTNSSGIYTQFTGSSYYSSSSSYGDLKSVSTSKDWTLATGLKNQDDNKNMYMVQNVYNSFDNQLLQTITMTFSSNHEYAVVYESGLPRVVMMGSSSLQLQLSAGRAAYVLVY